MNINDNICKEWNLNKIQNPLTKKKIKKDSPIYKNFEKICNDNSICKLWNLNKNINPITKRKIKNNSPIYKNFEKLCVENKIETIKSLILSKTNTEKTLKLSSLLIDSSLSYSILSSNNKILKEKIIDIIKIKRKKNLLIITKFFNDKFKISDNNNCLTIKNNNVYINNIIQLKKIIGVGGYGIVYLLKYTLNENDIIDYVIKLTILDKYENLHEIRILEFLTKYALDYEFPHFPITYDILFCKRKNLNQFIENEIEDIEYDIYNMLEKRDGDMLFIINEFANGGDLNSLIKRPSKKYNNNQLLNALSQIFMGMMFYHKYVNSSHGDLHSHNVLHHITEAGGYFHYKLYDIDYYIENIGHIWVIWDFGLSVPLKDSYKINLNREKELKNHIFTYLKNIEEPDDLTYYLGSDDIEHYEYLYDEFNNKYRIRRNNCLFDLTFFSNKDNRYCIYNNFYIANQSSELLDNLIKTINTDVIHKYLKSPTASNDVVLMQKLLIEWMVKMNLLLTKLPENAKIINENNPYTIL